MKIILIVVDTLRPDHLGCYGYFRDTSPNMDRIARDGVLCEDFYAAGAATATAFPSIITGLYPINNHVYRHSYNRPERGDWLHPNIPTIAEIMQMHGYTTAAVDNLINFRSHPEHYVRGYEYYLNPTRSPLWRHPRITADDVNEKAFAFLQRHGDDDFFLFLHPWDPHLPYNAPMQYKRKYARKKGDFSGLKVVKAPIGYEYVSGWGVVGEIFDGDKVELIEPGIHRSIAKAFLDQEIPPIDQYDGEIAYLDSRIGQLVDLLESKEILDDTLIAITGDHGEQLGQHGIMTHSGCHDAHIRVPFIIRYPPGLPRGKRISGFIQHVDIVPTILDVAGLTDYSSAFPYNPPKMDGQSIAEALGGKEIREEAITEVGSGLKSIRSRDWKLIVQDVDMSWRPVELYNVQRDPMEVINLVGKEPSVVDRLRKKLQEWMGRAREMRFPN